MLVEDDNNLREIYEARLLAEGYEVVSAKDGEEALALATKEKPDLIISDVMMPKISGFDMLDILRSTPEVQNTKVVMMTALSQAEDKDRADKLGADRYLVKSQVTLEDVARVADELINGSTNQEATGIEAIDNTNNANQKPESENTDPVQQIDTTAPPAPQQQDETPASSNASEQPAPVNQQAANATGEMPAQSPPPAPAPTMPTVEADNTTAPPPAPAPQQQDETPVSSDAPEQPVPAGQQVNPTNDMPTQSPPPAPAPTMPTVEADNTTSAPVKTSASDSPKNGTSNAQTTAEEEAVIDKQIDEFVQNQLHSNETAEDATAEAPPQQEVTPDPADQLNQGEGFQLPNAEPTQTIAVKEAPGTNQQPNTAPPPQSEAPNQAVEQNQETPEPSPGTEQPSKPEKSTNGTTGGQRVIQPISNPNEQKPNLTELAANEEEQAQSGPLPASSVVAPNGQTVTPPPNTQNTQSNPDPTATGSIIQPSHSQTDQQDGSQPQNNSQAQSHDPNDPNNIAL